MSNYYSTDEDYDAMKDDYLTGDSPWPVTRRQRREYDEDQRQYDEDRRSGW